MPKVIVHVAEAWVGGVSSYVRDLCYAQLEDNCDVYLLLSDEFTFEGDSRVKLIKYKSSRSLFQLVGVARKVASIIDEISPDVVFSHSSFSGVYVRWRRWGFIKVIHIPHAWPFLMEGHFLKRFIYRKIEKYLAHNCDHIVCMSIEEFHAASNAKIPNCSYIYTGIPELASIKGFQLKSSEGKCRLKVGFVGRFDFQKGFDLVSDVIESANSNEFEFHLVGSSVRGDSYVPDGGNVYSYGWREFSEVQSFLLEVDIMLFPSRWEGFSLAPLEAFRASTPVIVSSETSLHEFVIDGFNGFIMPSLDLSSILLCLQKSISKDLPLMGVNAYGVYKETLTFESYFEKMRALYEV